MKKLLSMVLALLILFQTLPVTTADGSHTVPEELEHGDNYLVIHDAKTDYGDLGGPSKITVLHNGKPVAPAGDNPLTYSNVPVGAELTMQIAFHLEDGKEDEDGKEGIVYQYGEKHSFFVDLPEGITYTSDCQQVNELEQDGIKIGTWQIRKKDNSDDYALYVVLNNATWLGKSEKRGVLSFKGSFNESYDNDGLEQSFELGGQTVVVTRPRKPEAATVVSKKGVYDAARNVIVWTVTVTPPENVSLAGRVMTDDFSNNQTYKADSFRVGSAEDALSAVADAGLTMSSTQIKYTFPADLAAGQKQVVVYETTPSNFSGSAASFTNKAKVRNPIDNKDDESNLAKVEMNWLSKTAGEQSNVDGFIYIPWTVKITPPEGTTITNAVLRDTIMQPQNAAGQPVAHTLVEGDEAHPVKLTVGGVETNPLTGYTYANDQISYTFASLSEEALLTYYTKVSRQALLSGNNGEVTLKNSAAISWEGMPGGPDKGPTAADDVRIGTSGQLISKAAGSKVNYTHADPQLIRWTVKVNETGVLLEDAVITDTVPAGQELYIDAAHKFEVNGVSATVGETFTHTANSFTYTLPASTTQTHTITYYTKITDFTSLYKNASTVSYGNKVVLTSKQGNYTSEPTQDYGSQMLDKGVGSYNYADRTVQWTLTVNRNRLPMKMPFIEEQLPAGMVLKLDADHPFKVENLTTPSDTSVPQTHASIVDGATSFTYAFGKDTDESYKITFYTYLTDAGLLAQGQTTKSYENTAKLKDTDKMSGGVPAKKSVSVNNPVVEKTHDGVKDGAVTWTVILNPGKVNLTGAYVADELHDALRYVDGSVALYTIDIGANGKATGTPSSIAPRNVSYDKAGNTLRVDLPDGPQAYKLVFTTVIEADEFYGENTIDLRSANGGELGTKKSGRVSANNLWSGASAGNRKIEVYKIDEVTKAPLTGAVFALYNSNKLEIKKGSQSVTATTGANGYGSFENLPNWGYYVKEISPPNGYLMSTEEVWLHEGKQITSGSVSMLMASNKKALLDVSFRKVGTDSAPLTGGTFLLRGQDFAGVMVEKTASADNGSVAFTDVPMGEYTISETDPPNGYEKTDATLKVFVEYTDAAKTSVKARFDPEGGNELINTPPGNTGALRFTKVGTGDAPLMGAKFRLLDSNKQPVENQTAESDASGMVVFSGVLIGTYFIEETEAPAPYVRSEQLLQAVVALNANGTAVTGTVTPNIFKNELPSDLTHGTLSFKKTDSDNAGLAGATFTLYNGSEVVDTATSGQDGTVIFTGVPVGEYTIVETRAPDGYFLYTGSITASVRYNDVGTGVVTSVSETAVVNEKSVSPSPVGFSFVKRNAATGEGLAGAKFNLYDRYNAFVMSSTSGPDGVVRFDGLRTAGAYTAREEAAPAGFIRSDERITVTVNWNNGVLEITSSAQVFDNSPESEGPQDPKGTISFTKVDEQSRPLSGASFVLKDAAGQPVGMPATSGANGLVRFDNVPIGTYTIVETNAPAGYRLSDAVLTASVYEEGGIVRTTVSQETVANMPDETPSDHFGTLRLTKVDERQQALGGAQFTLYDAASFPVATQVSGADGSVVFEGVPAGSYTVRETRAPSGYTAWTGAVTVTVVPGEGTGAVVTQSEHVIMNVPEQTVPYEKLGTIEFMKVATGGEGLAGAQFTLYNQMGQPVQSTISQPGGYVRFTHLSPGEYTVRESAPPAGFYPTDKVLHAVVYERPDGTGTWTQLSENVVVNQPIVVTPPEPVRTGDLFFIKVNEQSAPLFGAEFALYDAGGRFMQHSVSQNDGTVRFSGIPVGSYTIREMNPPQGYQKTDLILNAQISVQGGRVVGSVSQERVVNLPVTPTVPQPQEPQIPAEPDARGIIELVKTDGQGAMLSGAAFALYDANGNLVKTAVSGANGLVRFEDVPMGMYSIRETQAPAGYRLADTRISAVLTDNGATVRAEPYTVVNARATDAFVRIKKVSEGSGAALSGAEFTLYNAGGRPVATAVSGMDGMAIFADLTAGSYTLRETAAPRGYVADAGTISVTVEEGETYDFTVRNRAAQKLPQAGGPLDTMSALLLGSSLIAAGTLADHAKKRRRYKVIRGEE